MGPGTCPFCNPLPRDILAKNEYCYVRRDRFPVSKGHLLIIPFRHVPDLFSLSPEERQSLVSLVDDCRAITERTLRPDGYNIGINIGAVAGQSIMHCHCHFIPRYAGDADRPRGGIRGVIPRKIGADNDRAGVPEQS